MGIMNDVELANTRVKLDRLTKRLEALRDDASADAHVRELTMRSIKGTMNQFREEIARYEGRRTTTPSPTP